EQFLTMVYGESLEEMEKPLQVLLEDMRLARSGHLNIAGALLFAKGSSLRLSRYSIRAVTYPGDAIDEASSLDRRDISGRLTEMLEQAITYILIHVQHDQDINPTCEPTIPRVVLEEIVGNALIHRDYFIPDPITIFVFRNRVEIRSPGHLPNTLTVENIKAGNVSKRNPILASFVSKLLPDRGYGSGIMRAHRAYPNIEFTDDKDGNKFVATIWRK
ncbi:MAG: ATP-binding protein, partial [Sphaerochaeta sp.]|nr:ATP-binding protein [Sphaerochaeta sp.]